MRPVLSPLVILLLLATGCAATWAVDEYEAPDASLAKRRTYAWTGGEFGSPNDIDAALVERADQAMRLTIETELLKKGYHPAPVASADMHLSYQVAGQRRFVISDDRPVGASAATESMTPGSTPSPPASAEIPREKTVRDGTVILFIDDPKTGRLIWRGLVNAETRVATTESVIEQATDVARSIAREIPAHTD
jgi:hypothetical protein